MNVYTCADHDGHYPVGASSVVVAPNEDDARKLLVAELATHGIKQTDQFTLRKIDIAEPRAYVLQDGDY